MCHFFVVCLYLYYCSRHPVFKRRELVSHYQITSRHVYVAFSYLYCCFIVCYICIAVVDIQFSREEDHYPFHRLNPATYVSIFSDLYYWCTCTIFRRRYLLSHWQIKSRLSCVTFLLFVHICFIDANAQLIEELPTNLEHTSSLSIFRGVRAAQSLVFCVVLCRSLFVFSEVLLLNL